jgi:pimeloyl-ACP methyl ester carboxylesterase
VRAGLEKALKRETLRRPDITLVSERLGVTPSVLLLHAGGERRRVWREVMFPLSGLGISCIAYDQRGHGESGGSHDACLPQFGADTAAMIEALERPVVVGSSLGGFAALSALADPAVQAKARGLILVDVIPDPNPHVVRSFLKIEGPGSHRAAQVEDILGRADELRCAASRLTVPVLLIRAGLTTPIRDEDADRFHALVPHAGSVSIEDAGHLVARDQPHKLAKAIGGFVSEISAACQANAELPTIHPSGDCSHFDRQRSALPAHEMEREAPHDKGRHN